MVDLNQTIEIEYREKVNKPDGGVMIRAMVPGITKDWPMPLHLTPEQAEALGDPTSGARFKVKLVQSTLKDGKDGSWPSDFWYNVAIFEGVVDERNIKKEPFLDSVKSISNAATDMPKVVPTVQAPSISREDLIVKQVIFKEASTHAVGDTVAEVVMNLDLLFKEFTKVFYGDYKSSPLVEEASKQGAKIVDIKTKEEPLFEPEESSLDNTQWDYKKPQGLVTYAEFVMYVKNCGWIMEDVIKWLGMEVEAYVSQAGKGYMTAAKLCKDKALEQGLEPPFDFRQEKKETK
tara:strand:- start:69 stop:938 length:870 start_codon:yes stop_codon:yes gene_type:complete